MDCPRCLSSVPGSGHTPSTRQRRLVAVLGTVSVLWATAGIAQPLVGDSTVEIDAGTYAGIRAPIHLERRGGRGRGAAHFLRAVNVSNHIRFVGWNPARLPIAVAFRHGRGEAITAADSVAYWAILEQMEADIGMRLFTPATVGPDDDPVDVIVVAVKPSAGADGVTLITWTSGGEVYDARVYLRARSSLSDARVVTHEMMHSLGFGHTDKWASVMSSPGGRIGRLTPGDVAHAHLSFRSRSSAAATDMWRKLTAAMERAPENPERSGDECRYSSPAFECGLIDNELPPR